MFKKLLKFEYCLKIKNFYKFLKILRKIRENLMNEFYQNLCKFWTVWVYCIVNNKIR